MKLLVITVGGTIDKVYFDAASEYKVGEPTVPHIYQSTGAKINYEMLPLMRKDSLEMDDADRALIREACENADQDNILITHGTDTMSVTTEALKEIKGKSIVLTGAMAPARFRETDAIFNIGFATAAVQAMPPGIYIAMNGQIFPAGKVIKNREAGCFEATE